MKWATGKSPVRNPRYRRFGHTARSCKLLTRSVHGIAKTAGLNGAELGYILAAIDKIQRV